MESSAKYITDIVLHTAPWLDTHLPVFFDSRFLPGQADSMNLTDDLFWKWQF